jgi:hypothetical protein
MIIYYDECMLINKKKMKIYICIYYKQMVAYS